MSENFFAKFGQGGELVDREWFGIHRGEEIFDEPSFYIRIQLDGTQKSVKRVLLTSHEVGME